jgi:hypothetical protein
MAGARCGLRRLSAPRGVAILPRSQADVAQLVEHHLAKVRVAGSSPVIRSGARSGGARVPVSASAPSGQLPEGVLPIGSPHGGVAEWFRQGSAKPCTPVQFRAPPPSDLGVGRCEAIAGRTPLSLDSRCLKGARSSAGERCLHTAEAAGSIPAAPTRKPQVRPSLVAIALLLVHGWVAGRASQLRGLRLLAVTLVAGAFGVVMILLKLVVTP